MIPKNICEIISRQVLQYADTFISPKEIMNSERSNPGKTWWLTKHGITLRVEKKGDPMSPDPSSTRYIAAVFYEFSKFDFSLLFRILITCHPRTTIVNVDKVDKFDELKEKIAARETMGDELGGLLEL